MLDTINASSFAAHLNSTFAIYIEMHYRAPRRIPKGKRLKLGRPIVQVRTVARPVPVKLIEVKAHEFRHEDNRDPFHRHPFSLIFLGPKSKKPFEQKVYKVEHRLMGKMEILLVPLGPDRNRFQQYEAVFN